MFLLEWTAFEQTKIQKTKQNTKHKTKQNTNPDNLLTSLILSQRKTIIFNSGFFVVFQIEK